MENNSNTPDINTLKTLADDAEAVADHAKGEYENAIRQRDDIIRKVVLAELAKFGIERHPERGNGPGGYRNIADIVSAKQASRTVRITDNAVSDLLAKARKRTADALDAAEMDEARKAFDAMFPDNKPAAKD